MLPLPHLGVVAVTGYDEIGEVYRDTDTFSSCNSVIGPFAAFPVPLEGDDVTEIVAQHRDQVPMHEHMVTMDPPGPHPRAGPADAADHPEAPQGQRGVHVAARRPAARRPSSPTAAASSSAAYSQPFAMLAVADLLGVPEEDHQRFRDGFGLTGTVGEVGRRRAGHPGREPAGLARRLVRGLHRGPAARAPQGRPDRSGPRHLPGRQHPGGDLGGAHGDVPVRRRPGDHRPPARLRAQGASPRTPALQDELRADRDRIPDFLEEVLRIESPVKADFRLALRTTTSAASTSRPAHRSCC